MSNEDRPIDEETPTLEILKQIRDGITDPKRLDPEIRQGCVWHLWIVESRSVAEIAQILNVSDKTIRRDKEIIKEKNAKKFTPEDKLKILGELLAKASAAYENLMRLARSKEGSLQEKSQTAYLACKAIEELIKLYQSMGYFPSKSMEIGLGIHYSREEEMTPAQLKEELARLEKAMGEKSKNDPEIIKLKEAVIRSIGIAEAKEGLVELEAKIKEIEKE